MKTITFKMTKTYFIAIFFLISLNCKSQNHIEYQLDNDVKISIPENFNVTDTLGQTFINAEFENGLIIIGKSQEKEKSVNIENEQDLLNYYKELKNGVLKSINGKLISESIIEKNNLKIFRFSFLYEFEEIRQIIDCEVIFLNGYVYTFQFWSLESFYQKEKENFFSSLKINKKYSLKDQLNNYKEGSTAFKLGEWIGGIIGYIIAVGGTLFLVHFVSKKRKNKQLKK